MPTEPRTRRAIVGALVGLILFVIAFAVSDLEMGIGRAELSPIHAVFAAAIVALFAYLFSRKRPSGSADDHSSKAPATAPPSKRTVLLAVAALIGGPILALVLGLVVVAVSDVDAMDRIPVVRSLTILGLVVGTLVATVLAVTGRIR
jgi:hypothetical protein